MLVKALAMFMEYVIPAFNEDKEGVLARAK
jgi:hypothetical protein